MFIKDMLKKNKFIYNMVVNHREHKYFDSSYKFEDRSNDKENLCIILSGYKEFTWDVVFERIKTFADKDMDICILSSGVYSEKLSKIAEENNWSYLSIKKNCVTLAQNIALKLFDKAKYVYKLDEDIFVTKNFFKELKHTYNEVNDNGEYNVGFVAPIIPINGYGHVKLLKKLDLVDYYENNFEDVRYVAGRERMIESSPKVAKFMWGKDNKIPQIDDLDRLLYKSDFQYSACPIRFSIGAIYFEKKLWKDMGYFKVEKGSCMGLDETQMCSFCVCSSRAMIIAENTCVGHLSFGTQNEPMEKYFKKNKALFEIKK